MTEGEGLGNMTEERELAEGNKSGMKGRIRERLKEDYEAEELRGRRRKNNINERRFRKMKS